MSKENIIKLSEFNLKSINNWIELADKKAGFFLTISLALFSASFTIVPKAKIVICKYFLDSNRLLVGFAVVLLILFFTYLMFVISGIYKLIQVISPRLTPKSGRKSILFYETIKDMELSSFKKEIQNISDEVIVDELSDQAYNNSVVASKKYAEIQKAIKALKRGGLLAILFILIILLL